MQRDKVGRFHTFNKVSERYGGISSILMGVKFGVAICTRYTSMPNSKRAYIPTGVRLGSHKKIIT
jgi:hypothetical protein